MDTLKRSRNCILTPTKSDNDDSPIKKLYKSSFNNSLSEFFEDSMFDELNDNFEKENNTNLKNSPLKLKNNDEKNKMLDFSNWQRCTVISCKRDPKNHDQIVELRNCKTNELGICRLQGPWSNTNIQIERIVSILGNWCTRNKCFVVNKDYGFIIINSDDLMSATSVVGSLFCRRKSVLQDKFRGIDSDDKIMVIGSLVHDLFQTVLSKKLKTFKEIENCAQSILQSQDIMFMLYSSKLSLQEAKQEIQKFLPNIVNFVEQYIYGYTINDSPKDVFQEKIDEIQDIEENLWTPQFGLKGKIDVTVKIHEKKPFSSKPKIMPIELKTGKSSFSMEHKGQVILYQMMLNEMDQKIESGLLLYLKDGIMKEIPATRNEQRDLIILRNDLSYHLNQNIISLLDNKLGKHDVAFKISLPEPINHASACSKCSYNTICSSFVLTDKANDISSNHPFRKVIKPCTEHLNEKDLEYFTFWCGMLSLEEEEIKKSNKSSSILWTKSPEERKNNRGAIIDLKIDDNVEFINGKFIHIFEQTQSGKKLDFTIMGITLGEYVIVSTSNRIAVAAGHVFDLQSSSIKLTLERNLLQNYKNSKFIIDKYDSQSGLVFDYTNLGTLIENSEISNRLRSIVIDKIPPTFNSIKCKQKEAILLNLNGIQRAAVNKALTMDNYMLIKGLPGTGKTQTLVAIIRSYHLLGKSVLITSHTNSAVDNLLLRLKAFKLKFLRLGSESRINSELNEYCENKLISNCKDPDDLARIYSSYQIVGATCLGSSHTIFTHRKFDICIVDEATQVFQTTVLRPLFFSSKFILVGDPDQLPPLVRSNIAKQLGADQSLFHRLDSPEATSILTYQYRMNKTITKLANGLTYGGNLLCADNAISLQQLKFSNENMLNEKYKKEKWITRSLEKHIDQAVILVDTKNCFDQNVKFGIENELNSNVEKNFNNEDVNNHEKHNDYRKFKYINYCDASIVFNLVKAFLIAGYSSEEIGIIAPFRAQVELLKNLLNNYCKLYANLKFNNLEVNTVDQYQGRDKKIILYSCTKTGNPDLDNLENFTKILKDNEILEDRRRLTVAITRSKQKLIIIGDEKYLQRYSPFKDLFSKIPARCKIVLEDGKLGFNWKENFKILEEMIN